MIWFMLNSVFHTHTHTHWHNDSVTRTHTHTYTHTHARTHAHTRPLTEVGRSSGGRRVVCRVRSSSGIHLLSDCDVISLSLSDLSVCLSVSVSPSRLSLSSQCVCVCVCVWVWVCVCVSALCALRRILTAARVSLSVQVTPSSLIRRYRDRGTVTQQRLCIYNHGVRWRQSVIACDTPPASAKLCCDWTFFFDGLKWVCLFVLFLFFSCRTRSYNWMTDSAGSNFKVISSVHHSSHQW